MLGNRTIEAIALLAVCGGFTMTVNLLVMDARAGHIGEISSNNDRITATPISIAGPSDPNAARQTAVLAATITPPGQVTIEPTGTLPIVSAPGDD